MQHDFEQGLGYLKSYKEEHGDCRVPGSFKTGDGFKLGSWVNSRRQNYKAKTLSAERIDALDQLGFIWDAAEDDFQQGLGSLKAYKEEHGDCRVPQTFKTEDGFNLGRWVGHRRREYNKKKLSAERIDALDQLGFIWDKAN